MRVFLKTFGCSSNRAETAALEHLLREGGTEIVGSAASAEAVVVNTCTVRRDTELRVMKYISSLAGKRVVVTGCMAEVQPAIINSAFPQVSIVSPHNLPMVAKALASEGRTVNMGHSPRPIEPSPYSVGVRHVVTISRGCLGRCSYCIVRLARGSLASVRPEKIVESVASAVARGAKEILLSSQDTGVYGMDLGVDLPHLLGLLFHLEGEFRMRVGMFGPSSVAPYLPRLVQAFDSQKIYKFAHIPVQSGSDRILGVMNRNYRVQDFCHVLSSMRSRHPNTTLFTDVIVGFPGESEDDFKETFALLEEVKPDKTHIARFSPRPHTPASAMRQVPEDTKKRRSSVLTELVKRVQLEKNAEWVGRVVSVTAVDSFTRGGIIARTDEYKTVAIGGMAGSWMGRRMEVAITSATPFFLVGEISRR